MVGSSLLALARSPRPPQNAQIVATQLSYDTELRWTPTRSRTSSATRSSGAIDRDGNRSPVAFPAPFTG